MAVKKKSKKKLKRKIPGKKARVIRGKVTTGDLSRDAFAEFFPKPKSIKKAVKKTVKAAKKRVKKDVSVGTKKAKTKARAVGAGAAAGAAAKKVTKKTIEIRSRKGKRLKDITEDQLDKTKKYLKKKGGELKKGFRTKKVQIKKAAKRIASKAKPTAKKAKVVAGKNAKAVYSIAKRAGKNPYALIAVALGVSIVAAKRKWDRMSESDKAVVHQKIKRSVRKSIDDQERGVARQIGKAVGRVKVPKRKEKKMGQGIPKEEKKRKKKKSLSSAKKERAVKTRKSLRGKKRNPLAGREEVSPRVKKAVAGSKKAMGKRGRGGVLRQEDYASRGEWMKDLVRKRDKLTPRAKATLVYELSQDYKAGKLSKSGVALYHQLSGTKAPVKKKMRRKAPMPKTPTRERVERKLKGRVGGKAAALLERKRLQQERARRKKIQKARY